MQPGELIFTRYRYGTSGPRYEQMLVVALNVQFSSSRGEIVLESSKSNRMSIMVIDSIGTIKTFLLSLDKLYLLGRSFNDDRVIVNDALFKP